MTSKERVSAVLNHQIPDKVPWGEWAIDFDTVSRIIGRETFYRAKAKSQMAVWEGRRDGVVESWTADAVEFFRKMDCFDIINVSAMASSVAPPRGAEFEKPRRIDDTTWEFASGKVVKYSDVTADLTTVYDPVFELLPDGTRWVPRLSDVPTEIPAPGLPFSLVFRAEPGREDVIFQVASAYEAASRRRIPPPAFGPLA